MEELWTVLIAFAVKSIMLICQILEQAQGAGQNVSTVHLHAIDVKQVTVTWPIYRQFSLQGRTIKINKAV